MEKFLLSYDLKSVEPSVREPVKAALKAEGWRDRDTTDVGRIGKLPNTTLIGEFANGPTAKARFESAISQARLVAEAEVTIRKVVITRYERVLFQSDALVPVKTKPSGSSAEGLLKRLGRLKGNS